MSAHRARAQRQDDSVSISTVRILEGKLGAIDRNRDCFARSPRFTQYSTVILLWPTGASP